MTSKTIAAHETAQVEQRGGAPAGGTDGPALAILRQYWPQLRHLLPSHIKPEAWYAAVYAALYKGTNRSKRDQLDLMTAANKNPESLMFALFDAARLGLDPGTEQYYLTPRPNKNAKNGVEVLGIRGYQGEIELIYRAGAVSSVVVEVVRSNDFYRYERGVDQFPVHRFDPWASNESRGDLVGVYAYCIMKDGAISRVVELNQDDINRAMAASPTANSSYSPWKTDAEAMWLKTGVHRIQKFVPTSAEYIQVQTTVRATAVAEAERRAVEAGNGGGGGGALSPLTQAARAANPAAPAETTEPGAPLDPRQFAQPPAPEDTPTDAEPLINDRQSKRLHAILTEGEINRDTKIALLTHLTGRDITSSAELTVAEAELVNEKLAAMERMNVPLIEAIVELIDRPDESNGGQR